MIRSIFTQVKSDLAKLQLTSPVCTKEGEKIALSRRVEKHWRLIGWGQIQKVGHLALTDPAAAKTRHESSHPIPQQQVVG